MAALAGVRPASWMTPVPSLIRSVFAARKASGQEPHPIDERVVAAVATHPRAGGVAVGFDRLHMVLSGGTDIREFQIPG